MSASLSKFIHLETLHLRLPLRTPTSLLDDALPHLLSLRVLVCHVGKFTAHLFSSLPPTLKTLTMYHRSLDNDAVDLILLRYASCW
ncbi:hypothetical protein CALCODRAFT_490837, partial [Calocera cornea HHB12733]